MTPYIALYNELSTALLEQMKRDLQTTMQGAYLKSVVHCFQLRHVNVLRC